MRNPLSAKDNQGADLVQLSALWNRQQVDTPKNYIKESSATYLPGILHSKKRWARGFQHYANFMEGLCLFRLPFPVSFPFIRFQLVFSLLYVYTPNCILQLSGPKILSLNGDFKLQYFWYIEGDLNPKKCAIGSCAVLEI